MMTPGVPFIIPSAVETLQSKFDCHLAESNMSRLSLLNLLVPMMKQYTVGVYTEKWLHLRREYIFVVNVFIHI